MFTFDILGHEKNVRVSTLLGEYVGAGLHGMRSVFFMYGIQEDAFILNRTRKHVFTYNVQSNRWF